MKTNQQIEAKGKMSDEVYNAKLAAARETIAVLPELQRTLLAELLDETQSRHTQLKQDFQRIREFMDDSRLLIKYLLFDREASRRELEELRRRNDDEKE